MRKLYLLSLLLTFNSVLSAQNEIRESNFIGTSFHYGFNLPLADMGKRFGPFFNGGASLSIFNNKLKATMGIEAEVLFGENVDENVLAPLQLDNNGFLGDDGGYADVFLRMRGTYVGLYFNKLIKANKSNPNAGIAIGFGLGMLQHKIRINVESNNAPQFEGDYAKGYDRHTVGPALKQSLQYLNIARYNNFNYAVELEFMEGFTRNLRPINFDTKLNDDATRFDLNIKINFKWYLPIKDLRPSEEIFY